MNKDGVHSNGEAAIEISTNIEELERIIVPGVATSPGPVNYDVNYHATLPVEWGYKINIP